MWITFHKIFRQSALLKKLFYNFHSFFFWHTGISQAFCHSISKAASRIKTFGRRLKNHLHFPVNVFHFVSFIVGDVFSIEQNLSIGTVKNPGDHIYNRRLSTSALPDDRQLFSRKQFKTDIIHRLIFILFSI